MKVFTRTELIGFTLLLSLGLIAPGDRVLGESLKNNFQSNWVNTSDNLIADLFDSKTCSKHHIKPEIKLVESTFPNAFVSPDSSLTISSGLLDRIDSSEELAFVLAHEAGHIILGHHNLAKAASKKEFIKREIEADEIASKILRAKKYDPKIGITVLKKLTTPSLNESVSLSRQDFPSIEPRIAYLSRGD